MMRQHETLKIGLTNFEDNYYWLNELAEILNPYLSEVKVIKWKNLDFFKIEIFVCLYENYLG